MTIEDIKRYRELEKRNSIIGFELVYLDLSEPLEKSHLPIITGELPFEVKNLFSKH